MLARIATSRGIQLGFQVMLTMVSIDGELNEELSRSLSLAKEFQVELACEIISVGRGGLGLQTTLGSGSSRFT